MGNNWCLGGFGEAGEERGLDFIRLENVSHVYQQGGEQEHAALQNIDLIVPEGEFVAVLGTNGSGKSTLAKHFNALLLPTSGVCQVAGFDTQDEAALWQIRQQVGMVFQNPDNQLIAAVVEDDVAFGPENLGVPSGQIRHRVTQALAAVGMEKFRKFAPHLLSGGQKQRVAIAGALAMQTRCLVLDEPTAMLDPQGRREVIQVLQELHDKKQLTIIYITHFMSEAALADRVIVMAEGSIKADGHPAKVFADVNGMKELGLDVPLPVEVAWQLRQHGISLPQDILMQEDLAVALCP